MITRRDDGPLVLGALVWRFCGATWRMLWARGGGPGWGARRKGHWRLHWFGVIKQAPQLRGKPPQLGRLMAVKCRSWAENPSICTCSIAGMRLQHSKTSGAGDWNLPIQESHPRIKVLESLCRFCRIIKPV